MCVHVCTYAHTHSTPQARRHPARVMLQHSVDAGHVGRWGDLGIAGGKSRQESPRHLPDPVCPGTAPGTSLVPIVGPPSNSCMLRSGCDLYGQGCVCARVRACHSASAGLCAPGWDRVCEVCLLGVPGECVRESACVSATRTAVSSWVCGTGRGVSPGGGRWSVGVCVRVQA